MNTKPKYKAIRSKNPYDCSVESARDIICQRCTWTGARKIARALNATEASKKPKPKPFMFDWSGVPEKYRWAAMDANACWFAYDEEPNHHGKEIEWFHQRVRYVLEQPEIQISRPPYPGDWRDSLQERPTK